MTDHPRFQTIKRNPDTFHRLEEDDGVLPASVPVSQQRTRTTHAATLTERLHTSADAYAAAALYEHLSRLSDAELRRRGLSRSNVAREAMEARSRQGRPTS